MGGKRLLHFVGARLECLQQIAVPPLKVLQHIRQLAGRGLRHRAPERGRRYGWPVSCRSGLRSRGSVAGLNGRTITRAGSGRRWRACRFRNVVCDKVRSLRCESIGDIRRSQRAAANFARLSPRRCDLTNFRKAEQIGDDRLPAPVFVGAVGMQAVAAAAGFQVDQRQSTDHCCPETRRTRAPPRPSIDIAIGPPRRQAGRDRRGRFQRLLIERPRRACACRRNSSCRRAEKARRRRLQRHQPAQAISARPRHRRRCRSRTPVTIRACGRRALS